jgi:hypothetical protein
LKQKNSNDLCARIKITIRYIFMEQEKKKQDIRPNGNDRIHNNHCWHKDIEMRLVRSLMFIRRRLDCMLQSGDSVRIAERDNKIR